MPLACLCILMPLRTSLLLTTLSSYSLIALKVPRAFPQEIILTPRPNYRSALSRSFRYTGQGTVLYETAGIRVLVSYRKFLREIIFVRSLTPLSIVSRSHKDRNISRRHHIYLWS